MDRQRTAARDDAPVNQHQLPVTYPHGGGGATRPQGDQWEHVCDVIVHGYGVGEIYSAEFVD